MSLACMSVLIGKIDMLRNLKVDAKVNVSKVLDGNVHLISCWYYLHNHWVYPHCEWLGFNMFKVCSECFFVAWQSQFMTLEVFLLLCCTVFFFKYILDILEFSCVLVMRLKNSFFSMCFWYYRFIRLLG